MSVPVQQKRKTPWWVWLVAAVVVGLLLWWLLAVVFDDDDDIEAEAPVTATTPPMTETASPGPQTPTVAGTGAVTDGTSLLEPADPAALVGRSVEVSSVPVLEVIGEHEMWVGTQEQRLFVVLDQSANPADLTGRVDAGDQVSMTGLVRELPPLDEAQRIFGLRDEDVPTLEGEDIYVGADSVTVR